jgi:cyclase
MSAPHHDHDHPDLPPPAVEEVADGVYAYVQLDGSWGLNNSGFLVGRDGVTVIDTCFTERRTRALIDTISSVTPLPLRTLIMGSVAGSLAALERLRLLGPDVIVPGHGSVCGLSAIDDQVAYLRFVQEVARPGFDAGTPPLDLASATDLGRFAALTDPERLVGNLYRAYSELRGEPLGHPIDPQAYADMITYNGGEPLRCWA